MNIFSLFKGNDDQGLIPAGTNISINNRSVKIIGKIGEGGFATVYSAKDHGRKYAVKHCKCMSTEQIELIDHEIEIMQKCATTDHPNIVFYYGSSKKIFASQESPRRVEYFILLEYMDSSLITYIKQHQEQKTIIPEKRLFELFLDIVNACFLLHAQHPPIAHRDIKIDNILIKHIQNNNDHRIRLKLCDFGSCVDGTPKICQNTHQINIESEMIDRFTTPSYRSPEMIDLYQRKELSTKVDVWALGCVLFLMAYYEHPFPEGAKMSILDAKYKIPDKDRYSKKVTKLLKLCFHKDPTKRPTTKQISEHLTDIIAGGKGTLSGKKKIRSNSNVMKTQLLLKPKSNLDPRRKSLPTTKEEVKVDGIEFDETWDPFSNEEEDMDDFEVDFDNVFEVAQPIKLKHKSQSNDANGSVSNKKKDEVVDPFFSNDFAADFFGNDGKKNKNKNKKEKVKKRKSGNPKPIDVAVYNEHKRNSKRKKKKEKPTRSRSKSPIRGHNKVVQHRPLTPQPPHAKQIPIKLKPAASAQNPRVFYGDQLAQLISMGFNDSDKNLNAILRAKGNIQVAVNILITQ